MVHPKVIISIGYALFAALAFMVSYSLFANDSATPFQLVASAFIFLGGWIALFNSFRVVAQ